MAKVKNVLLARPNSAIVKDMRAALERNGYTPITIEALDELKSILSAGLKGVVISTGVVSTVEKPFVETFEAVRQRFPDVPVIFSTQAEVDRMAPLVESTLKRVDEEMTVLKFDAGLAGDSKLGSPKSVVLLSKMNLIDPKAAPVVDGLFTQLFK